MAKARRWLRPRNLAILSGLLLLTWVGSCSYSFITAKPGTPYPIAAHLNELTREFQGAGENGWDLAMQADEFQKIAQVQALLEIPIPPAGPDRSNEYDVDLAALVDSSWIQDLTPEAVERILQRSRRAIVLFEEAGGVELLDRVAASPAAQRPIGHTIESAVSVSYFRNLLRLCIGRMASAHDEGRQDQMIASARHSLAIGRITLQQPLLLDQLVGRSFVNLSAQNIREFVLRDLSAETLGALLEAVRKERRRMPPPTFHVRGERIFHEAFIHRVHTDNGRGGGRLIPEAAETFGFALRPVNAPGSDWIMDRLSQFGMLNLLSPLYAGKKAVMRKHEEFYEALLQQAATPRWQRDAVPDAGDVLANLSPRYTVLDAYMTIVALPAGNDGMTATLDGTELFIAIELHHTRTGRLPQALAELVPTYLPSLPLDPYTGKPYIYTLLPDDTSTAPGSAYLLYSTGVDGVDNNAAQHPEGFDATHPSHGAGYDFVFNKRPLQK
jgi:hypothetical protein